VNQLFLNDPLDHSLYHDFRFGRGLCGSQADIITAGGAAQRNLRQRDILGQRLLILGQPPESSELLLALGAQTTDSQAPYQIDSFSDQFRGEHPDEPWSEPLTALQATSDGKSFLTLRDANNKPLDQLIVSANGALLTSPWVIRYLPDFSSRWVTDPIALLSQALGLPEIPAADITTENGRRLLTVHIDGDGFPNRARRMGTPYTAEVILEDILRHYRLPTTVSVIEGEIGSQGKHRAETPTLEAIARRIFAEDYVEIASHSFSHPFFWEVFSSRRKIDKSKTDYGFHLDIPGYKFNLEREITGSINYINSRLAPPNKRTKVMLWTGDALPAGDAIRLSKANGVLNVNGGNSWVLNSNPTLSKIWPIARYEGDGLYQIYAPVMNENVFTNLWNGPFWGYRRVIETFKLTDSPYRLKPFSIYYHFYSADNPAGLKALHKAYDYALSKPHTALYLSDYARRAEDFFFSALAKDHQGNWRFNSRHIRTLRLPTQAPPPAIGTGLAGYLQQPQGTYLHLIDGKATIAAANGSNIPYLVSANVILDRWEQNGHQIDIAFTAYEKAELILSSSSRCRFKGISSQPYQGQQVIRLPKGAWQGTLNCATRG